MKRKEIAVATVAALCASTALAQSGVTLYGVIDVNTEYVNNVHTASGDGSRVSMQNGFWAGSRWGLRGVEDLGKGLQGVFALEGGFSADDGKSGQGGRLFGRQAFVGLKSDTFGQLTLGRQYTSLYNLVADFEPLWFATYSPLYVVAGLNFREDNNVVYTKTIGALTAQAHYSFGTDAASVNPGPGGDGEIPGQYRRGKAYGAGVAYLGKPFGATLLYDQYNPSVPVGGTAFSSGTVRKAIVAGSYSVGQMKFMSGYRWGKNDNPDGSVALRDDYYWIGLNYQATSALGLYLDYGYQKIKTINSATSTQPNPWQLAFLASYSLSKRTDLYLSTAYAKHAGLTLDQAGVTLNSYGYALPSGKDSMFGAAIGIRHKF